MGYLFIVIGLSYVVFLRSLEANREHAVNLFAVSGYKELGIFYYHLHANSKFITVIFFDVVSIKLRDKIRNQTV